jgi:hypothetical protein
MGDKIAWLLEQELKNEGTFDQKHPYNSALAKYRLAGINKEKLMKNK